MSEYIKYKPGLVLDNCGSCAHLLHDFPDFICRKQNRWMRLEDTCDTCSDWTSKNLKKEARNE